MKPHAGLLVKINPLGMQVRLQSSHCENYNKAQIIIIFFFREKEELSIR